MSTKPEVVDLDSNSISSAGIKQHLQIEDPAVIKEKTEQLTNLRILYVTTILFSLFVVAEVIGAIVSLIFSPSFFLSLSLFDVFYLINAFFL